MTARAHARAAVLLAGALVAGACGEPEDRLDEVTKALESIIATCAMTGGDVQVKRAGAGYWEPAGIGAVLRPGDWVRTGKGSGARLEFLAGGRLELQESAVVVIDAIEVGPAVASSGGPRKSALVAVEAGEVRGFMSGSEGEPGAPLSIRTASGERAQLSARGEDVEFHVRRGEAGTEIQVARGEATLAVAGQERVLESGTGAEVTGGVVRELQLLPGPAPVEPRADTRLQLVKGRSVRLAWASVAAASGYRVEIARDPKFGAIVGTVDTEAPEISFAADGAGAYVWRAASRDATGRLGGFGPSRRFFLEADRPEDLLGWPEHRTQFGFVTDRPRIAFSWKPMAGAKAYRLRIAASPDLGTRTAVDAVVDGTRREVSTLGAGTYYWGVYDEGSGAPLFLEPRLFRVRKVPPGALETPKVIKNWGG